MPVTCPHTPSIWGRTITAIRLLAVTTIRPLGTEHFKRLLGTELVYPFDCGSPHMSTHCAPRTACVRIGEQANTLADLGGVPMPMSPAEFATFIADETEKWGKVIRTARIKAG